MSGRFSVPPNAFPSPNQPSFSLFAPVVQFSSRFFSIGCALLPRSFLSRATSARDAVLRKLTRFFSLVCALFAQNGGVAWVSLIKSRPSFRRFPLSPLKSILTKTHLHKLFRMNTQHPTKDADPERPSGAEGFLPYSSPTLTTVESILTRAIIYLTQ